eukprot:15297510-Alexandrium_andersonii.AAC.1
MLSHSNFWAPRSGASSCPVRTLSPIVLRPSGGGPERARKGGWPPPWSSRPWRSSSDKLCFRKPVKQLTSQT